MLRTRVITALVLVFLFGWLLFGASDQVWFYAVLVTTFAAGWEWAQFAKLKHPVARLLYAFAITLTTYLSTVYFAYDDLILFTVFSVVLMTIKVFQYQLKAGHNAGNSPVFVLLAGFLILTTFATSLTWMKWQFEPLWLLLSLMVIWAVDIGAYFSGRAFGKRKLAVHVSPGKTWEGVYGGFIFAFVVVSIGLYYLAPQISIHWVAMAFALSLIGLYSVIGDLFESLLKRQVGVKDSSQLLPGHGGVLDRLDSSILAVPMFYLLWQGVMA